MEMPKAVFMPVTSPSVVMRTPPITGPSDIGIRRMMECNDIPMAVFLFFNVSVISDILAGSDTALQAEKKIIPINTAIQFVNSIAIV